MPRNLRERVEGQSPATSIEHRIKFYSIAAAAAGVSMLALSQPAEGEIVYTKADVSVPSFGGYATVDLNNDGKADFQFMIPGGGYDHSFYASCIAGPMAGGEIVGGNRALHPYASALVRGATIGPTVHFSTSAVRGEIIVERSLGFASASTFKEFYGQWNFPNGTEHFLGVKFLINGATHYGWIRLTIDVSDRMSTVIKDYAYETVANQPIKAGAGIPAASVDENHAPANQIEKARPGQAEALTETPKTRGASLGMLALGADG